MNANSVIVLVAAAASCQLAMGCGVKPDPHMSPAFSRVGGCFECHADNYRNAKGPDHFDPAADPDAPNGNFRTECQECHGRLSWRPAQFPDHDAWWPLVGRHLDVECRKCHIDAAFTVLGDRCEDCHLPAYEVATEPDHVALALPKTCALCHDAMDWAPSFYDDHAVWPLTGAHDVNAIEPKVSCASCHQDGVYRGTKSDCYSCHQAAYDSTNHASIGRGTGCATCHNTTDWRGAATEHLIFPLAGAHTQAACVECHAADYVYVPGQVRACVDCHRPSFDATTNPDHSARAQQITTRCEDCHGAEKAWLDRTFPEHDELMLISREDHRRYQNDCNACHQTASASAPTTRAWAQWTCIGCHDGEHSRAKMDNEHDEEPGYTQRMNAYVPVDGACLSCHPRGLE